MSKKKEIEKKAKKLIDRSSSSKVVIVEIVIGLVLSLGSLWIFAEIADEILEQETQALDVSLSQLVYSFRSPLITDIMNWVTMLGAEIALVISGTLFFILFIKKQYHAITLFVLTLGMGLLINTILKFLYQRARPDIDPLMHLSSYSFPSGHSMNSFIFYALLAYFVFHFTRNRRYGILASIIAGILIVLIGFSRVYLGVHYPSDVLAGFIAGFFVFVTAVVLDKSITYMRSSQ